MMGRSGDASDYLRADTIIDDQLLLRQLRWCPAFKAPRRQHLLGHRMRECWGLSVAFNR